MYTIVGYKKGLNVCYKINHVSFSKLRIFLSKKIIHVHSEIFYMFMITFYCTIYSVVYTVHVHVSLYEQAA